MTKGTENRKTATVPTVADDSSKAGTSPLVRYRLGMPLSGRFEGILQECSSGKYLFKGQSDGKDNIRSAQNVLKATIQRMNISKGIRGNGLRYNFATRLLESDTNIRHIEQLIECNSIETAMTTQKKNYYYDT
jgi:site-specific recombinase XerC